MRGREGSPLVIAHRGASADAPEHTRLSYEAAVAQGADLIELDLQLTADGALVCLHDDTLARVAGLDRRPADLRLEELRGLDVGSWFNRAYPERARPEFASASVLTLDEVLESFPARVGLYLELKSPEWYEGRMEERVVATLASHDLVDPDRVVLESFDASALRRLRSMVDLPTSLAWHGRDERLAAGDLPEWVDISAPSTYALFLAPGHVERVRGRDGQVHVWTVDDAEEVEAVLELGVDGLFTNRPAAVRALLR